LLLPAYPWWALREKKKKNPPRRTSNPAGQAAKTPSRKEPARLSAVEDRQASELLLVGWVGLVITLPNFELRQIHEYQNSSSVPSQNEKFFSTFP